MEPTVRVSQGEIHVNSVWIVQVTDTVIVLQADVAQKYAQIFGYSSTENEIGIVLGADERTQNAIPCAGMTTIHVAIPDATNWSCVADVGRYTVTLVAFCKSDRKEIWTDNDDDNAYRDRVALAASVNRPSMRESIEEAANAILRSDCTVECVPSSGDVVVAVAEDVDESRLQELREWPRFRRHAGRHPLRASGSDTAAGARGRERR